MYYRAFSVEIAARNDFGSANKHAKYKELHQHPAILTARLVNNPYIYQNGKATICSSQQGRTFQSQQKQSNRTFHSRVSYACVHLQPFQFFRLLNTLSGANAIAFEDKKTAFSCHTDYLFMFQNDLDRKNPIYVRYYFNQLQQVFTGFVSCFYSKCCERFLRQLHSIFIIYF